MNKIYFVLTFLLMTFLIACDNGEVIDEPIIDPTPIDSNEVKFNEGIAFLEEGHNYTMTIAIKDFDTLIVTETTMVFDGKKTQYIDGDVVIFYDNSGAKTQKYTQNLTGYEKTEINKNQREFYYDFNYEMFSVSDSLYLLKYDAYESLGSFGGDDAVLTNVSLEIGESHLSTVSFSIEINEKNYKVDLIFTKVNQSSVTLPEVA